MMHKDTKIFLKTKVFAIMFFNYFLHGISVSNLKTA